MSAAKTLGGFVVLAAVIGGGLYGGDRYAEGRAEEYASGLVSEQVQTTAAPVVDIKGWPFLTQLVGGTLDEVTATMPAATVDGISVTDVSLDAHDVQVRPAAGQPRSAGAATVVATLPTASIAKAVQDRTGLTVQLAVSGSALQASGDVLGQPLTLTMAPRVDAGTLLVDVQGVSLGGRQLSTGDLPSLIRDRLSGIEVPLDALPSSMRLTEASVVPTGVRVTASGTNVTVPDTGS